MQIPDAGELNRRIKIRLQDDIPNMASGLIETYADLAQVWAKYQPVGTGIYFGSKQIDDSITDRFYVRRSSTVTEKTVTANHVIDMGNERFRVKRVSDIDGKRRMLVVDVESLGEFFEPQDTNFFMINSSDSLFINGQGDHLLVGTGADVPTNYFLLNGTDSLLVNSDGDHLIVA